MIEPFGFENYELVHAYADYAVYRAFRLSDREPVFLKVISCNDINTEKQALFDKEYDSINELDIDSLMKPVAYESDENTKCLVYESNNYSFLQDVIQQEKLSLEDTLSFAIDLIAAIGDLHSAQTVHGGINPYQILFDPKSKDIKLFGLGAIGDVRVIYQKPGYSEENVRLLHFLSPEYKGMTGYDVDYRADFYSFGVVLFNLLTEKLPFELAKVGSEIDSSMNKLSPRDVDSTIPESVSDIVMKLLSIDPLGRYQSIWGINADFEQCLDQLNSRGKIYHFPLARYDVSSQFNISDKLYGREEESKVLFNSFGRVSRGTREVVLVSGYAGVGKTSLVNQFAKTAVKRGGQFISGKFYQNQKDSPKAPMVSALQSLVKGILSKGDEEKERWKESLLEALGENVRIIADAIPEVEQITGEQPPVPEMGAAENQNRFNYVIIRFIELFCRQEHPLVIFIDDLQWSDQATTNLLETIVLNSNIKYLMCICSYRENEVDESHHLRKMIQRYTDYGEKVREITLTSLSVNHVSQLITDLLGCDYETSRKLAELVNNKTAGNPLFIDELLKSLYHEKLLYFNSTQGKWDWDIAEINAREISGNVVDFLTGRIQRLSPICQQLMMTSACIGGEFDSYTLSSISEKPTVIINEMLDEALKAGVISKADSGADDEGGRGVDLSGGKYKFYHDRIQQAAASLIFKETKPSLHYKVGHMILENTPEDNLEENIFDIVNQLNMAIELIKSDEEKTELSKLNLIAGKKAKAITAYDQAVRFFSTGVELLGEDIWSGDQKLVFDLSIEVVEAAALSGNYVKMEEMAKEILSNVRSLANKLKVYEVLVCAHSAQNKPVEAVDTMLKGLNEYKMRVSRKPSKLSLVKDFYKMKWSIRGLSSKDFMELPEMENPAHRVLVSFIAKSGAPIYVSAPELFATLVFKMTRLLAKEGNIPESVLVYSSLGIMYCGVINDIERGYKFGELSLKLLEKFSAKEIEGRTIFIVAAFITHWKKHANNLLRPLKQAHKMCLNVGDFEYASYALTEHYYTSLVLGEPLAKIDKEMYGREDTINELRQEVGIHYFNQIHQAVQNLMGESEDPRRLVGNVYNEEISLPLHLGNSDKNSVFTMYNLKIILCFTFEDYEGVIEFSSISSEYIDCATGWYGIVIYYMYDSLARLALYDQVSVSDQKKIRKKIASNQKKLKSWADHAPINHLHKYLLVEAEFQAVLGHSLQAASLYGQAIELAKESGYINEEALANELASKYYLKTEKLKIASAYMVGARARYEKWGALAKVEQLDKKYSRLINYEKFSG